MRSYYVACLHHLPKSFQMILSFITVKFDDGVGNWAVFINS